LTLHPYTLHPKVLTFGTVRQDSSDEAQPDIVLSGVRSTGFREVTSNPQPGILTFKPYISDPCLEPETRNPEA